MEKTLKLEQNNIQSQLQYSHLLLASTDKFKIFQDLMKSQAFSRRLSKKNKKTFGNTTLVHASNVTMPIWHTPV